MNSRIKKGLSRIGFTFNGEIWEDNPDVPMGKGYANDGKPFNIEEACYLKPIFRAVKNPNVRKVVYKSGVQSLKTFLAEKCAAYFIVHAPGEMAIYDCDIDAALDHCKSRLMPWLKSVPAIADQIREVQGVDRNGITTTEFYLPGMTLRAWPLNESATQRITLRYVIIHDGFLSKNTGMLDQAVARTTQHPNDKKIIIESQGSEDGDDFDRQYCSTNQAELHVKCPLCGEGQPFEFSREREDGTMAGFQRGPDEKVLTEDGKYNETAIMRETHYECFHCRGKWLDIPETRKFLDEFSYYVPTNPNANPENVGFNTPNWINRRIIWGSDTVMLGYLTAKKALQEHGLKDPIKQWYQKRAGKTWNENLVKVKAKVIIGSHNIEGLVPGEVARVFQVDPQQDPDLTKQQGRSVFGHFWYVAWAIDKNGKNIYQLARGYARSVKEWVAVRKSLNIPNKNVAVDGGNWLHEILDLAAEHWEEGINFNSRGKPFRAITTWTILRGNGTRSSFPHETITALPNGRQAVTKVFKVYAAESYYERTIQINGQPKLINIPVVEWSNLSVKDQLFAIRQGGEGKPKLHILPREKLTALTQEKEKGACRYEQQVANEYRTRKNNRDVWIESSPEVHYNDCDCEGIVQFARGGFLGHIEASAGEVVPV